MRKSFVFMVVLLSALAITMPVMAQQKVKKDIVIKQQKKQLGVEKEKAAKLQRENEELRQKMLGVGDAPKQKQLFWWEADSKRDCIGWSSFFATIGAGIHGFGVGSNDPSSRGAKMAGAAIVAAVLIAPTDSSYRCIGSGIVVGEWIGDWQGLRERNRREEHQKPLPLASFGSGTTTSGGTTPPPPPPNAPPVMKVMPFFSQNYSEESGRPNPVAAGPKKTERIFGVSVDYHF